MNTTIFKTLTSHGLSGEKLIKRLEKNYRVSDYAKELLYSSEYKASVSKGKTYNLVLIKGEEMGKEPFTTQEMRDYAKSKGYITPPAEVAVLIREEITDEEIEALGLVYLIVAHEPIKDSGGCPGLLDVRRGGYGRWLDAGWVGPDIQWRRDGGWLFLAPQDEFSDFKSLELSSPESLELESAIKVCKDAGLTVSKIY